MILGEEPLGKAIKQWRTNLGLTAVECANRAGIAEHTWRRIEDGSTASAKVDTIRKMLTAMNAQMRIEFAPHPGLWQDEKEAPDATQTAPHLGPAAQ